MCYRLKKQTVSLVIQLVRMCHLGPSTLNLYFYVDEHFKWLTVGLHYILF